MLDYKACVRASYGQYGEVSLISQVSVEKQF